MPFCVDRVKTCEFTFINKQKTSYKKESEY